MNRKFMNTKILTVLAVIVTFMAGLLLITIALKLKPAVYKAPSSASLYNFLPPLPLPPPPNTFVGGEEANIKMTVNVTRPDRN